jgi:hypothetical protein
MKNLKSRKTDILVIKIPFYIKVTKYNSKKRILSCIAHQHFFQSRKKVIIYSETPSRILECAVKKA